MSALGIALAKFEKETRNDIRPYRRSSSYAQAAIIRAAQCFHNIHCFINHRKYFLAVEVQFFSRLREVRFAPNLVKKLDAQALFKVTYLRGDRRLAEMQFFCIAYITTILCNRLKRGELMQVERAHKLGSPRY